MNPIASAYRNDAELAILCKACGDPLRLNVLRALHNDSFGVLELTQIFAIGQSGMSHHLKVLAHAGLVATRREGNAIFYRRALPQKGQPGSTLHAALLSEVDRLSLSDSIRSRIAGIHRQRAQISHNFFTRSATKFQEHQDLIASLPHYRESVLALLDNLKFSAHASVIEIGPGDGKFLPELSRRFQRVFAVDNSEEMLVLAQSVCQRERLPNVRLILADAMQDDETIPPADCVVLNMVLHHLAAPADAIGRLSQRVRPGGSLLITDLCRHHQDWAKLTCGDLWMGFEQEDLTLWAQQAELLPGESLYIGLRNGFQIQVRHFVKPAVSLKEGSARPVHHYRPPGNPS